MHALVKQCEVKCEENVVSDSSPLLTPSHYTLHLPLDAVAPDRARDITNRVFIFLLSGALIHTLGSQ